MSSGLLILKIKVLFLFSEIFLNTFSVHSLLHHERSHCAVRKQVLSFLESKKLLSEEGEELLDLGIDSSISIHERMLTDLGNMFMEKCYNNVINCSPENIKTALETEFCNFENTRLQDDSQNDKQIMVITISWLIID